MIQIPSKCHGRVLVFIPTYNDVEQLAAIITEVHELNIAATILVLDDGSMEPVVTALHQLDCLHFRLPANFGLGVCTQIAFDHALRHEYDAIIRVDADGQHPVTEIPALLELLENDEADVVVATRGNRDQGSGQRAFFSRIARSYLSTLAWLLTSGSAPSDVNSGFFAANQSALKKLNANQLERFPEPQMYVLACRLGLRVGAIVVVQLARQERTSTVTVSHGLRLAYRFSIFALSELIQGRRA
jgi:glycosyltransferase involved in cell wall biosynthesis